MTNHKVNGDLVFNIQNSKRKETYNKSLQNFLNVDWINLNFHRQHILNFEIYFWICVFWEKLLKTITIYKTQLKF